MPRAVTYKILYGLMAVLVLLSAVLSVVAPTHEVNADTFADWYNASWSGRIKITLTNASLADFPTLLTSAQMTNRFWSGVNSSGADIVACGPDGVTKLKRELVNINTTAQTMELYVKTPENATTIYIYYNNPAGAETNDAETWDANFKAVYHMNDGDDTSHIHDSTTSAEHGIKTGANTPVEASGVFDDGKSQLFTTNEQIDNASFTLADDFTIEAIQKTTTNDCTLVALGNALPAFGGDGSDRLLAYTGVNYYRIFEANTKDNIWHYIAWSGKFSDITSVIAYFDDTLPAIVSTMATGSAYARTRLHLGKSVTQSWNFIGKIDEIRISNIIRPAPWVLATHNSLQHNAAFATGADNIPYTLTYNAGVHGSINGSSPQVVNYGANGTSVTAIAGIGYYFVNWSDASTQNPRIDTNVVANITVIANFAINTHSLTINSSSGGNATDPGEGIYNYDYGTVVAIEAIPDIGYEFVNWTGDIGTIANITNLSTTITINGNYSITANFLHCGAPTGLSISEGTSSITLSWLPGAYTDGTIVVMSDGVAYNCSSINLSALPYGATIVYNGSGDSVSIGGLDKFSHTYYFTLFGTLNGDYSTDCRQISYEGSLIMAIILPILSLVLTIIALWQKSRSWKMISAIPWAILAIYSWNQYQATSTDSWNYLFMLGTAMVVIMVVASFGSDGQGDAVDDDSELPSHLQYRKKLDRM